MINLIVSLMLMLNIKKFSIQLKNYIKFPSKKKNNNKHIHNIIIINPSVGALVFVT